MEILTNYFIYFIVYSLLGWICEVIYCSIIEKKFVNRGFLFLPICPIYGFGAIIMYLISSPFGNMYWAVFIIGFVITSLVEYLTSFVMERAFGLRLWDYSHRRFNLNGRVCLRNSIMFGILILAVVYLIQPNLINLLTTMNITVKYVIAISLFIVVMTDTIWTILSVSAFAKYVKIFIEKVETEYKRKVEYFLNKFPSMRFNENKKASIKVKEFFENRKNSKQKPD